MLLSIDTRSDDIRNSLITVFNEKQTDVLSKVIITAYNDLVKTGDFNELKSIVKEIAKTQKELAEAQNRTEVRIEELAESQKELAESQKELAESQKELTAAQKKTENIVQKLAIGLDENNKQLGGLSRSVSYSLENEAYRMLPKFLKGKYGIELKERLVRKEIGGKEINILGKGKYRGKKIILVGEAKLKLDESWKKKDVFGEIDSKADIVKKEFKDFEIVKLLITHYARKTFLDEAEKKNVIVVQSFEW